MGLLQMRLPLSCKDYGGAMIVRTYEKLVLVFCMLHHLVIAEEYLLAAGFEARISRYGIMERRLVPLEVAFFPEWLFVRTSWMRTDQGIQVDVSDVRMK
jgi:hypothetical protein